MAKNDAVRGAGRSIATVRGGGRYRSRRDPALLNGPVITRKADTGEIVRVEPELDERRYADSLMRFKVLQRDGYRCRYCGEPVTDETANIDHVHPWLRGGRTKMANLVTACQECNKRKGNQAGITPRSIPKC
jgi:hypothetical protein